MEWSEWESIGGKVLTGSRGRWHSDLKTKTHTFKTLPNLQKAYSF